MALINTRERSMYFDDKRDLVAQLRLVLTEEMAAVNAYQDLIRGVRMMGRVDHDGNGAVVEIPKHQLSVNDAETVAVFLEEITKDEMQHMGKLLSLMDELDPATALEIRKGRAGA